MEPTSFGDWLRLKRKALDLTREGLALRVGCSAATIRKIEAEERRPSAQITSRLAEIFEIPANERTSFRKFARGDWQSSPSEITPELPWRSPLRSSISKLPATATSLIGREDEISQVREYLLEADRRLVTLIGPPGIGKTRLSIAAARAAEPDFPEGVFFVPLAALDNPVLLAATINQSLGFVAATNLSIIEQLEDGIGDKRMLLVLDNCEHLIEGVAFLVADLLSFCSQVKILTTSRESLRVAGEWLYPVPVLRMPKENTTISLETAADFPALTLFTERARAVRADFNLEVGNVKAVSSICARLDGLPLAIELIAAHMRLLSLQTLLERLNDRFIIATGGLRTANTRQKTLNNAIGWSYNLLSVEEKALFACLSIFTGGFTLEAAEAIFPTKSQTRSIPELITSLLDKSLLQRETNARGDSRFSMLVTIQQFALDCLRRANAEVETRHWHQTYFLDLTLKAVQELKGPRQVDWLRRLNSDRDNLHAALSWAIETSQTETALSMACRLFWFWFRTSDLNAGRHWLGQVVALPDAPSFPECYAEALSLLANNNWLQTGPQAARPFVEKALAVAREHGDRRNIALAQRMLGQVLWNELNFTAAQTSLDESMALYRQLGDEWEIHAHVILAMAFGPYLQKDWAASLALHSQALAGFRMFEDTFFQAVCLRFVGKLHVKLGNLVDATAAMKEALVLACQLDSKYEIAANLLSIGQAEQSAGNFVRAASLYLAAKNFYSAIGAWMQQDEAEFENSLAACQSAVGEAQFNSAVDQGRAMTTNEAIAFALA